MFSFIKQVFLVLLSFSSSLATKCVSLNDEPCIARPTLLDLNPVEIKYYSFRISLDKCTGSCNVLSPKISIPKESKDINFKAFNMITKKNEAKTMRKHISCDCKCTTVLHSVVQHVIQVKNGIIKQVNTNVKIIISAKKIIVELKP